MFSSFSIPLFPFFFLFFRFPFWTSTMHAGIRPVGIRPVGIRPAGIRPARIRPAGNESSLMLVQIFFCFKEINPTNAHKCTPQNAPQNTHQNVPQKAPQKNHKKMFDIFGSMNLPNMCVEFFFCFKTDIAFFTNVKMKASNMVQKMFVVCK